MRIERKLKLGRLFFSSDDIATFQDIFRLLIKGFSNAFFFIKDRDEIEFFFYQRKKEIPRMHSRRKKSWLVK